MKEANISRNNLLDFRVYFLASTTYGVLLILDISVVRLTKISTNTDETKKVFRDFKTTVLFVL